MPDSKISGLTSATTPLAGTEVLPIVQGGQTRQVSVANLTAGRGISVTTLSMSGQLTNTLAIGTAPFVITSTTRVANLNVATAGTADTLTTTRTLWGQNFNGGANVTGSLTSVGDITGTAGVTLTATGGTLGLAATGANVITASTNGSERMRIDASGNLGLGVTPAAWRSMDRSIQIGSVFSLNSDSNVTADVGCNYYWGSGNLRYYLTTAAATMYRQHVGAHSWFTAPSGTAGNVISFTQAMTLNASGNLLVGTTTADGMLTVVAPASTGYGAFDAASSGFANLNFKTAGTIYAYMGSANAFVTSGTANDLALRSQNNFVVATGGGTERLRITSAGNIHTPAGTTTMTDGFIYIPAAAGAPTGVATAITGTVPLYYNSSANILYAYNSSWQTLIGTGTLPLISTNAKGIVHLNSSSQATTASNFVYDNLKIGIGTSSPSANLHIVTSDVVNGLTIQNTSATGYGAVTFPSANGLYSGGLLYHSGASTARPYSIDLFNNDGFVTISTFSTERLRVTDAGVLQLSPVQGEGGELNLLNPTGGTLGGVIDVSTANNFRLWTANLNATMQIGQLTSTGGNIQFFTEASEKMRLISNGSLGIGTSTPSQKLHVSGGNIYAINNVAGNAFCLIYNPNAAAGSYAGFGLWNDNGLSANSIGMNFYSSGSTIPNEFRIAQGANAPMTFYTNGSERFRISNNGNLLQEQPAPTAVNTAATLTIAQVRTGIITSNATITITLPTGTTLDTYSGSMAVGFSFDLVFIVTQTGVTVTIGANGNTIVGYDQVTFTTPATFRFRKTGANTFTVYRIA